MHAIHSMDRCKLDDRFRYVHFKRSRRVAMALALLVAVRQVAALAPIDRVLWADRAQRRLTRLSTSAICRTTARLKKSRHSSTLRPPPRARWCECICRWILMVASAASDSSRCRAQTPQKPPWKRSRLAIFADADSSSISRNPKAIVLHGLAAATLAAVVATLAVAAVVVASRVVVVASRLRRLLVAKHSTAIVDAEQANPAAPLKTAADRERLVDKSAKSPKARATTTGKTSDHIRAIALILAAFACSCAGASARPNLADKSPLVLQAHALDWLGPPTGVRPFVVVHGDLGVLLEDDPASFRVFFIANGVRTETLSKLSAGADAPAPPHFSILPDAEVEKRWRAQEAPTSSQDIVGTLLVAQQLQARGQNASSDALLRMIAPDTATLTARSHEAIANVLMSDAFRAYARGAAESDLIKALTTAASYRDTKISVLADGALTAARSVDPAPKSVHDTSALDVLLRKRVADLHQQTCSAWSMDDQWPGNDPIGRIRSLGYTAIAALYEAQSDAHLSRCLVEGDPASLVTVGTLARETVQRITHGGETFDQSDVECGHEGFDKEATDLVDAALSAHDVAQAIAITRGALGWLRVKMVERLGNAGGADVLQFLREEARTSPVVLARVEAARTIAGKGDAWVPGMITAVEDALESEDASHHRCDEWHVVTGGLRELLVVAPHDTLRAFLERQRTKGPFGPHALVQLAAALTVYMPASASDAKARDALLMSMLDDLHPSVGTSMTFQGQTCADPTPSDLAAIALGKRLGVGYSCAGAPDAKRAAVDQIVAKMRKP